METKKTKWEQKEQIKKLIRIINDRITDLQVLRRNENGGLIMSNKVLRIMLSEHPQLQEEWDMLHLRKNKLKRLLWKLP